jgi:cell division initiation protein
MSSADRNLSVTPIDMRQREFSSAMRGFDRGEVTAFLVEAAGEFELALKENDRLRQDIIRLDASLQQFRDVEGSLKTTLMSAQKIADDMRETATKDAERIVREAEGQAELVLQSAQAKVEAAQRDIDALWLKRREAEAAVEATISVLQSTLEFIRERERRGRESNVVPHRPATAQTA